MKKNLSVLGLYAKSNLWFTLLVCLLTPIIQILLFTIKAKEFFEESTFNLSFLSILELPGFEITAIIGLIILSLGLALTFFEFNHKQVYTLKRLNISEKRVLSLNWLYNSISYIIFFVLQLSVVFILFEIYKSEAVKIDTAYNLFTDQTLFLSFYKNFYLHSLLPLEDILRHIRNIVYIASLGLCSAAVPYLSRHKKVGAEFIFLLILVILTSFTEGFYSYKADVIGISGAIILAYISFSRCYLNGGAKNEI